MHVPAAAYAAYAAYTIPPLQATPHLMLYVLHEPIAAEGDLPVVRRLLLTSANLSAAPWGYARGEQLRMVQSARARHHPPATRGSGSRPACARLPIWGRQEGPRILDAKERLRCCSAQWADSSFSGVPLTL